MNESQRFDDKKEHFTLQMWERDQPLWCVVKEEKKWDDEDMIIVMIWMLRLWNIKSALFWENWSLSH